MGSKKTARSTTATAYGDTVSIHAPTLTAKLTVQSLWVCVCVCWLPCIHTPLYASVEQGRDTCPLVYCVCVFLLLLALWFSHMSLDTEPVCVRKNRYCTTTPAVPRGWDDDGNRKRKRAKKKEKAEIWGDWMGLSQIKFVGSQSLIWNTCLALWPFNSLHKIVASAHMSQFSKESILLSLWKES